MPQVQSIREAFAEASSFLSDLGVSEPQRSSQLLLEHVLDLSGAAYYMALADPFPADKREQWEIAVTRRAGGEPVQYITGEQEFYGRPFEVTPDVLIPRPETELLVEAVLRYAAELWPEGAAELAGKPAGTADKTGGKNGACGDGARGEAGTCAAASGPACSGGTAADEPGAAGVQGERPDAAERGGLRRLTAIDIGAGSGAISVTLAAEAPAWRVLAGDISPAALAVAGRNAERLGAAVELRLGDLLEPFKGLETDILVSNPPYIPGADIAGLQREVRDHEPRTALDGGEDGLDPYRRMMEQLPLLPAPPRLVGFELGFGQAEQVAALLTAAGHWSEIVTVPDLAGIPRHVLGIAR
ncbi:peptide chain release factor N(5)-glutamine methyltransferase [Paenibacillus rhizophilus]|uniref:Release factor glutamine methyltransferase n=2 Tax=Paenibacillus rhizophilus TaxID=1850366 RepID=A0A3N9P5P8_9BACL|nr:HemK/PrmC family methyltransferase [Paenibacillus rhizophilus]RQW10414.1 peptide chain release factor N(5)-glutamine methyltransferase [Paenibacillus rhizophilus]